MKSLLNKSLRLLLVSLSCIALATPLNKAHAQKNLSNHDTRKLHFGMSMGVNYSRFDITRSDNFILHDTIRVVDSPLSPGFNVGIISDLHLSKHWDVRFIPSLVFANYDLRYTEAIDNQTIISTKTVESIRLDFPVAVKYKSERIFDNFRFYVLAGGRFNWDLASNSESRKAEDIVKISKYSVAADVGLGLEFYFPLFIFAPEIRLSQNINNVFSPTPGLRYAEVLDGLRGRMLMVSFQFEG